MKILYALWGLFVLYGTLVEETDGLRNCSELVPRSDRPNFIKSKFKGRWNAQVIYHQPDDYFKRLTCYFIDVGLEDERNVRVISHFLHMGPYMEKPSVRYYDIVQRKKPYWTNAESVYADWKTDYEEYAFGLFCENIPNKDARVYATIFTKDSYPPEEDVKKLMQQFTADSNIAWREKKVLNTVLCNNELQ